MTDAETAVKKTQTCDDIDGLGSFFFVYAVGGRANIHTPHLRPIIRSAAGLSEGPTSCQANADVA